MVSEKPREPMALTYDIVYNSRNGTLVVEVCRLVIKVQQVFFTSLLNGFKYD